MEPAATTEVPPSPRFRRTLTASPLTTTVLLLWRYLSFNPSQASFPCRSRRPGPSWVNLSVPICWLWTPRFFLRARPCICCPSLPYPDLSVSCGEIQHLRPEVLKVTPSKGLLLPSLTNYISYSNVTTIDDDVIEALAGTGEYNVLATDQAMALLMLAGKTAVPWYEFLNRSLSVGIWR